MPTVPGDKCVVCGNSRTKAPDATFHRFPHTYVHQLSEKVQQGAVHKSFFHKYRHCDVKGVEGRDAKVLIMSLVSTTQPNFTIPKHSQIKATLKISVFSTCNILGGRS